MYLQKSCKIKKGVDINVSSFNVSFTALENIASSLRFLNQFGHKKTLALQGFTIVRMFLFLCF